MDRFVPSDLIEVRRDPSKGRGGRGVFARRRIAAGRIVERVPVILIPTEQVYGCSEMARMAARISWYVFAWGVDEDRPHVVVALGYGSLYNHSYTPNLTFRCIAPDAMEFRSSQAIARGEELTINYNHGSFDEGRPMEFPIAPAMAPRKRRAARAR